jgi:redox-sensitive bicupin YhaK (pirin superfamily)
MVGPFIFFDHFGPVAFPSGIPRSVDVRPHPHIGLSTVTYLLDGEIMHRDSVGSEQAILPGEVNWMTAGRGITHSERFEAPARRPIHGLQAWVAPTRMKRRRCSPARRICRLEAGLWARLVAGRRSAPGGGEDHSPLFYVRGNSARRQAELQADTGARSVISGTVEVEGTLRRGRMLVFPAGARAFTTSAAVMLLGGEPVGERFIDWNFVSSSKERIEQAKADWRAGRMKLPDLDNGEFIPLPEETPPVKAVREA